MIAFHQWSPCTSLTINTTHYFHDYQTMSDYHYKTTARKMVKKGESQLTIDNDVSFPQIYQSPSNVQSRMIGL